MARTEEFAGGAEEVRQPQFKSVQQMHNMNYRAMSVLDTPSIIPNQNGMGSADRERKIMGFQNSASGQSAATQESQVWLRQPENAALKQKEG